MSTSERTQQCARRATGAFFGVLLMSSCADLFGIEPSTLETSGSSAREGTGGRSDPPSQGGAGAAGLGGDDSAGAAGTADGGMAGGGPSETGGTGATGGPGGEGGSSSGTGGVAPLFPQLGDACSINGLARCPNAQANHHLTCDGMTWVHGEDCATNQRCDRRTGKCAIKLCEAGMSTCPEWDRAEVCGPDLVSLELEFCDFACNYGVCVEPKTNEVFVDRPRAIQSDAHWPDPLIPVCLEDYDAWTADDIALVHSTFDEFWGRYTALALTGFGPCNELSAGVSLSFATECSVELARIPRVGYPGPSALLPITLCRSYRDSIGDIRPVDDVEVRRHAIAHVFGHVLNYHDELYLGGAHVMQQGVNLDPFESPGIDVAAIDGLQAIYGVKPAGSLVASSGRCLSPATNASVLANEICDGSAERDFRLVAGRLEHGALGECLQRITGDTVGLGACGSADEWRAARVAWLNGAGLCVSVRQSGDMTRPLIVEPCAQERAADQTWSFDFPSPGHARIRLARDPNLCVLRPTSWSTPVPSLGECDGVHALFETAYGELSVSGRCLGVAPLSGGSLAFAVCDGRPSQRFGISGPLETSMGVLTLFGEGDDAALRVAPLLSPPSPSQIFDFYFH